MNSNRNDIGRHQPIFHYSNHPQEPNLYSTIGTTLTNLLEIQHLSFMNLLQNGFGRHWPIFHYSDHPHKPIRNPIPFLYEVADLG